MGVSHLYTSLRTFAHADILDGDVVSIDGPALAYHALHLCRANGVDVPSYHFLGHVATCWLDKLELHGISVRSIFFDGYLPEPKLKVRIHRMHRLYAQLCDLYESNMHGCPASYVVQNAAEAGFNFFDVNVATAKKLIDPCFLVPAIIDALRKHEKYRNVTQLVPGEADQFCADDICKQGGTVLTSDSDLLVHNLGHGRVAFFRDVRENDTSRITFASFVPEEIFETIGLRYPEKALQLAYERQLSPRATLSQIIRKSSKPCSLSTDYLEFQDHFTPLQSSNLWDDDGCKLSSLEFSDPRISELILNFNLPRKGRSAISPVRMFLPPLLECPALKSAWDLSTCIRQLAYSVLDYATISGDCQSVQEFRRVQTLSSAGRKIPLLSLSLIKHRMEEIVLYCSKMMSFYNSNDHQFWIALGIAMQMSDSRRQGIPPDVLKGYERDQDLNPINISCHVPWAEIHLYAQVQGILYSFRILQQALMCVAEQSLKDALMVHKDVCSILGQLTPVIQFPNFQESLRAVTELYQRGVLESTIDTFVETQGEGSQLGYHNSHVGTETVDENPSINCNVSSSRSLYKNNMFSSLFID
ncbi:hypothetical protein E4U21_007542 [Claviceps maximensis]|nr:hypothetical protein E4U21_007542 [Claviceps maximensis]